MLVSNHYRFISTSIAPQDVYSSRARERSLHTLGVKFVGSSGDSESKSISVEKLIDLLQHENSTSLLKGVIEELGNTEKDTPNLAPALIKFLSHSNKEIQVSSIEALEGLWKGKVVRSKKSLEDALPHLVKLLADTPHYVAVAACRTLGNLRQSFTNPLDSQLPTLIDMVRNPGEYIETEHVDTCEFQRRVASLISCNVHPSVFSSAMSKVTPEIKNDGSFASSLLFNIANAY